MWWPGKSASQDAIQTRVLMVCMGNICRSPTAEAVLRSKLDKAGLAREVEVASAGTHGYHVGEPPDGRAQKHAARRGYDLSRIRAQKVAAEHFQRYDWVLAMDDENLAVLRELAPPDGRAKLSLLMAYAVRHTDEATVPDPYYGPPAGFERVLDLVEDACEGFIQNLRAARGTS